MVVKARHETLPPASIITYLSIYRHSYLPRYIETSRPARRTQRRSKIEMATSQWRGNISCWADELPNELLSETFSHYVGLDDSPWRLALVYKRWKHVALTTPSLWTCIIVADGKRLGDTRWDYFGSSRYSDGPSSVCHDIDEIGEAARRAGILPLRVDIISQDPEDRMENLLVLINQLFSSSFVNRIEDLLINVPETGSAVIKNPLFYPLSNLKSLKIIAMPYRWCQHLFKTIYAPSAGTLHSLVLSPRVNYHLVEEAISTFTQLKRLRGFHLYWPNDMTPQITIPQLIELEIECPYSYLTRIRLPRVQNLIIRNIPNSYAPPNDENYRLDFPQLTSLCAITPLTGWLQHIVAPKLQILSILEVDYTRAISRIHLMPPNLFPMVTHFTFVTSIQGYDDEDPTDSLLIMAFQSVPNAISVSMAVGSLSEDDPKLRLQLLDRLGSMEEEEILCPKLQELELRFRTRREDTLVDYETYLLHRVVDIRKKIGRGLNRFTVHWNQRGETITQCFS